jgi:hypothetical protein
MTARFTAASEESLPFLSLRPHIRAENTFESRLETALAVLECYLATLSKGGDAVPLCGMRVLEPAPSGELGR